MRFLKFPIRAFPVLFLCGSGWGQPVYEGFSDYAHFGDLLFENGGTGFLDPWSNRKNLLNSGSSFPSSPVIILLPESLSYTDSDGNVLTTSGQSLFISGENGNIHMARSLDPAALPNQGPDPQLGKTTYVSYLARRSGAPANPDDPVYGGDYPWGTNLYPRAAGLNLFSSDSGDAVPLFIGGVSNAMEDVWRLRGQDLDGVSKDPLINQPFGEGNRVYLVVLRIDHGEGDGGADEINMYLNPVLTEEARNFIGVTADWETRDDPLYLPGRWIGIEAGDGSGSRPFAEFTFDEFRIGQTWESVTPHYPAGPCGYIQVGDYLDTGGFLGWLYAAEAPWYFSVSLGSWIFVDNVDQSCELGGAWAYVSR
ncbi:MAG: hypothetical protein AB3N64_10440 [Puniceicoccaceae bacterium]